MFIAISFREKPLKCEVMEMSKLAKKFNRDMASCWHGCFLLDPFGSLLVHPTQTASLTPG
jgi:hypothetical protein